MDDAALVRRLAIEKLEAKAEELRPHWAWAKPDARPRLRLHRRISGASARNPPSSRRQIAAELQEIEDRLAALEALPEDAWTDGLMSEAEELETRRDELIETTEALAVYAEEDRALAGCIVTIGDDGEFRLYEGLVDARSRRSPIPARRDADDGDAGVRRRPQPLPAPARAAKQQVRKECGFSQVARRRSEGAPAADREGASRRRFRGGVRSRALCAVRRSARSRLSLPPARSAGRRDPPLRSSLNDLAGTPADRLLEARHKALDLDWLSLPPAEGFAALAALPAEAKQRLFAWCIAATLKPQLAVEDGADPGDREQPVRRLAIPFADFWRPTAANYWGRVKKAHGLAIAESVLGPRWARDHADDKKPILAAALETAFDPASNTACIGLDQAARDSRCGVAAARHRRRRHRGDSVVGDDGARPLPMPRVPIEDDPGAEEPIAADAGRSRPISRPS